MMGLHFLPADDCVPGLFSACEVAVYISVIEQGRNRQWRYFEQKDLPVVVDHYFGFKDKPAGTGI